MVSVNPQVFYDNSKKLTDLGVDIDAATTTLDKALNGTGSMAGSSNAAKQWATSYDTRAGDTIDNARKLAQTLKYFASLVSLAGYNHALANYHADTNPSKGAGPTKPASADVPVELCWVGPPASGGPGSGLLCGIAQVMEQIHIHIPDGDTDKLGKAASAWKDFAGTEAIAHAASDISIVNNTLAKIDSPEIYDLMDQLGKLKRAGHNLYKSADQLATACENLKKPLVELRKTIKTAFEELEKAIIIYLAIDLLATLVTAGAGVVLTAVTAMKFAKNIDTCATTVTEAVTAAKIDDALTTAAKAERILANTVKELDEVASLEAKTIEQEATQFYSRGGALSSSEVMAGNIGLPRTMETVEYYARLAGVDFKGAKIEIIADSDADTISYMDYQQAVARTDADGVMLAPSAFQDPETLVRTLGHESVHVDQYLDGAINSQTKALEEAAYGAEDDFVATWRRNAE
ncbi:hypothetical protein [Nocardia acidivorans]|uniref:hypothetical protein n=1 Tax=Nocardia acidivorans TaxID=404580 RepID=UPI000836E2C4|nr:hypothetical protein [Nocardia acidivorans]